jgi:shikimate dehydrogenase
MAGPRRAAVLGHPVAHSLSPSLHRAAYEALGLAGWRYDAVDVTSEELPGFVAAVDEEWAGLSLTMPLKHAVLPLLDHVEPLAQVVGAVNTVLVQGGGRGRTLVGANTDVYGLVAALREGLRSRAAYSRTTSSGEPGHDEPTSSGGPRAHYDSAGSGEPSAHQEPGRAAVLGGGATAASTLAALAELGVTAPTVYVRSAGRSGALVRAAHRMGVEPVLRTFDKAPSELAGYDLVVATLPPHGADALATDAFGADAHLLASVHGVLLDVAYDPRPTALASAWMARGGVAVGGERMLLHQAAEQVRLMTGLPAPLVAMERALAATLGSA